MSAERGDERGFALVVLDLAGTTVSDHGVVEEAFAIVHREHGLLRGYGDEAAVRAIAGETMGQSKIEVFRRLAADEAEARAANAAFEDAYAGLVAAGAAPEIPGAGATIRALRDAGLAIVLTTGFSPATRDALLDSLGWRGLVDAALSPVDAGGRGRPWPDLNLTAVLRTRIEAVGRMVVVGDTASDMLGGRRAGAGLVVGVRSGAHDEQRLRAAGADAVLDDVTGLSAMLAAMRE